MIRVLVLDALQRSALAITRSLGTKSIDVLRPISQLRPWRAVPGSISGISLILPPDATQINLSRLISIVKQHQIDILLPMTELATQLLLIHQESFHDLTLSFTVLNFVNSLADKNNLMQMADSLGVPVSKIWYVNVQKIAILQAGGFTLSICTQTRKNHGFFIRGSYRARHRDCKASAYANRLL